MNPNDFDIQNGVLTKYRGKGGNVTIPGSVTSIGDRAFSGCRGLADENGMVIVRNVLFDYCGKGGTVTIPDSVTSIGRSTFSGCSSLTSVTIPAGVTSIGAEAFRGCSSLTSVTIPDSVTSIGDGVFFDCTSLTSVIIPDSVTSIGYLVFFDCTSLTSVTMPDSVTSIGDCAFYGCSGLTSVTIPDSVTSIGNGAFENCTRLTSVTIPDGVTSIGNGAFKNCTSLTSVTIPDSVKTINLLFGEKLPDGLIHQISSWYPRMTDGTLKQYVLNKKTWNALDPDTQMKILVQKLSKALAKVLLPLIKQEQAERTAEYYLEKATSPLSAAECKKIAAFITYFHNAIPDQTVSALYKALLAQKNGKKPAEELVKDLLLKEKLTSAD